MGKKVFFEELDLENEFVLQEVSTLCNNMAPQIEKNKFKELMRWKHVLNPNGISIAYGAYAQGQLVSVRMFMRWKINNQKGVMICCRPVDTYTDPRYQRLGLFSELTKKALEHAKENEIDFIFNTPNAMSGPGYLKLGWKRFGSYKANLIVCRPLKILFNKIKKKLNFSYPNRYAIPIELDANSVKADIYAISSIEQEKKEFLVWRYLEHPIGEFGVHVDEDNLVVYKLNVRDGLRELLICEVLNLNTSKGTSKSKVRISISKISTEFKVDYCISHIKFRLFYPTINISTLDIYGKEIHMKDIQEDDISLTVGDVESL